MKIKDLVLMSDDRIIELINCRNKKYEELKKDKLRFDLMLDSGILGEDQVIFVKETLMKINKSIEEIENETDDLSSLIQSIETMKNYYICQEIEDSYISTGKEDIEDLDYTLNGKETKMQKYNDTNITLLNIAENLKAEVIEIPPRLVPKLICLKYKELKMKYEVLDISNYENGKECYDFLSCSDKNNWYTVKIKINIGMKKDVVRLYRYICNSNEKCPLRGIKVIV